MSAKTNFHRLIVLSVVLFAALFVSTAFSLPAPQKQAQAADANSCRTCHEDLYYLHDEGCSYCLTHHAERCVNCHEGNASAMKKEDAHVGLLAHPQANNGEKCRECHSPAEARERLARFAQNKPFDNVIRPAAYVPAAEVQLGAPQVQETSRLAQTWKWLAGSALLFAFWLVLMRFSPTRP